VKQLFFVVALAFLVPALAACASNAPAKTTGGAASNSAAPQQLAVKAMDTMRFDPATLNARAGQPIHLILENTGQIVHDFHITEGVSQPVTAKAQAGQTATATFSVARPGTYMFVCSEPGHEQAGMKGTLVVQ
jgi:plastocyanin